VRLADRLSLPLVRRCADAAAGLALVGATLSPVAAGAAPAPATPDPSVVVMTDLGPVSSSATTSTSISPATTYVPGSSGTPGSSAAPIAPAPASTTLAADGSLPPDRADDDGATWIIGPGDTLWHVAEATLTAELGRAPSAPETAERLDRLVAANRDRLAVPGDPGLVFPARSS
jgi:hypothetical protein